MGLKVMITAATQTELPPQGLLDTPGIETEFLVTGVGSLPAAWSLMNYFCHNPLPDIAINTGIAGSFSDSFPVGSVVIARSDCFGDLGVERDGDFHTLFESGLAGPDDFPFSGGFLHASDKLVLKAGSAWPLVRAVTVNTTSGSEPSVNRLINKFNPDIETMEGAAFYYVCSRLNIPAIAIRSISNMVEPGDRSGWDIPAAVGKLGSAVNSLIHKLVTL